MKWTVKPFFLDPYNQLEIEIIQQSISFLYVLEFGVLRAFSIVV